MKQLEMSLEQKVKLKLETYYEVREMLEDIAKGVFRIHRGCDFDNTSAFLDDLELEIDGHVSACFSEYRHGDTDYFTYSFPTSYLWDLDWEEKYEKEKTRKNLEAVEKRLQEEREKKEKKERQSYHNYLVLKKKYEGNAS